MRRPAPILCVDCSYKEGEAYWHDPPGCAGARLPARRRAPASRITQSILVVLRACFAAAEAGGFEGDTEGLDPAAIDATKRWLDAQVAKRAAAKGELQMPKTAISRDKTRPKWEDCCVIGWSRTGSVASLGLLGCAGGQVRVFYRDSLDHRVTLGQTQPPPFFGGDQLDALTDYVAKYPNGRARIGLALAMQLFAELSLSWYLPDGWEIPQPPTRQSR